MHRRLVFVAEALLVAACAPDLDIPSGTAIACEEQADCPDGTTCKVAIGRCVSSTSPDQKPPSVTSARVLPSSVRLGDVVTAELVTDEPLVVLPTVRFAGSADGAFQLAARDAFEGGERFQFVYAVRGGEAEGDVGVEAVALFDGSGNENPGVTLGTVEVDYTPPQNPSVSVVDGAKSDTATVTLALAAEDAAEMWLSGDLEPGAGVEAWVPFTASPQVTVTGGEGVKTISVRYRDAAHNTGGHVSTTVELDLTPPVLNLALVLDVGRSALASNSSFFATGGASPDATVSNVEYVVVDSGGTELQAVAAPSVTVIDGLVSGEVAVGSLPAGATGLYLRATLDDGAHPPTQETSPLGAGAFTLAVDDTPPAALSVTLSSSAPSPGYTNQVANAVELSVNNVGHADNLDLEMYFSGAGIADIDPLKDQWIPFSDGATVVLDDTSQGLKTFSVTVRDGAHNATVPFTLNATLDTIPPSPVGIEIKDGAVATSDPVVTVVLTPGGASDVRIFGSGVSDPAPTVWTPLDPAGEMDITLSTSGPPAKTINAEFRDLAGNLSIVVDVSIDLIGTVFSAPVLALPVDQSRVKDGDTIGIGGSTEVQVEILSARLLFVDSPTATTVNRSVDLAVPTEVDVQASGTEAWTFAGSTVLSTVDPDDGDYVEVEVVVRRIGGSCPDDCSVAESSRSAGRRIDRLPPSAPSLLIEEGAAVNTRFVTANLGITNDGEPDTNDIEVLVTGTGFTTGILDAWSDLDIATRTDLVLEDVEGNKLVETTFRDGAGHVVGPVSTLVEYDITPPSNLSLIIDSGAAKTNQTEIHTRILATGATEMCITGDVSGPPGIVGCTPWVTYVPEPCAAVPDASCIALALPVAESGAPDPANEGLKTVFASFRDAAGNEAGPVSASIELDRIPPAALVAPELVLSGLEQTRIGNGSTFGVHGELLELGLTVVRAEIGEWDGVAPPPGVWDDDLGNTAALATEIAGALLRETAPHQASTLSDGSLAVAQLEISDGVNSTVFATTPVEVDQQPAIINSLTPQGPGVTGSLTSERTLGVVVDASGGPTQYRLSGDAVATDWTDHDFATPVPVELSGSDGSKTVVVEVRDQTLVSDSDVLNVTLDTLAPDLTLAIALADAPSGKTHVHNDDSGLIQVIGSANEGGCTLVSADLMLDDGATITSIKDVSPGLSLGAGGVIVGSADLTGVTTLTDGDDILLQLVVSDAAGNEVSTSRSRSNRIPIDLVPPTGNVALLSDDPTNDTLVELGVSSSNAILACLFGADTVAGATGCQDNADFEFLPIPSATIALTGSQQGVNHVSVRFRDRAFNEATVVSSDIRFDNVAPVIQGSAWVSADAAFLPNGELSLWNDGRTITLEVQPSELPVTVALENDVDTVATTCDAVLGSTCYVDFASCSGNLCQASLVLTGSPLDNSAPDVVPSQSVCARPGYAVGDGLKSVVFWLVDAAGNPGVPSQLGVRLDRSCPDRLTLSETTIPATVTYSTTTYVPSASIELRLGKYAPSDDSVDAAFDEDMVGYRLSDGTSIWDLIGTAVTTFDFALEEQSNTLSVAGLDIEGNTGAAQTFVVTSDTVPPSIPSAGPQGVTFNGDTFTVLITNEATDDNGVIYQVAGGPYDEFTDMDVDEVGLSVDPSKLYPFFDVGPGIVQQAGTNLAVRARDPAGNVSGTALVTLAEESTLVLATTPNVVQDSLFSTSVGLWGDHVVWSDQDGTSIAVNHTDVGGVTSQLWSTTAPTIQFRNEIEAHQRFVAWIGRNLSDVGYVYLYDLGADEMVGSGDEGFCPANPQATLRLEACPERAAFDFDAPNAELAYVEGGAGCPANILKIADTSSCAPTGVDAFDSVQLCACAGSVATFGQVAIADGCVAYLDSDLGNAVALRCSGADGDWGTGDDTGPSSLFESSGDCSNQVAFSGATRALDMAIVNGDRVVVWPEENGFGQALCLWRESSGSASRIAEDSALDFPGAVLSESGYVYYLRALTADQGGPREAHRYGIASGTDELLPIPTGIIGRLRAWGDRLAVTRSLEGYDDQVELFDVAHERQVTTGFADHVAPDVDGDRAVWIGYEEHACGEVYLFDRNRNATFRLTDTTCPATYPKPYNTCPQISGTHVIWSEVTSTGSPSSCDGGLIADDSRIFGLDVASGPPFDAPIEITSSMSGNQGIFRPRISGDNAIFGAYDGSYQSYLYHFSFATPGTRPSLATPLTVELAGAGDIDGENIVYVYGVVDAARYHEIRMCSLANSCSTPETVVPAYNAPCQQSGPTGDEDGCFKKQHPRIQGRTLVWLDNRAVWDADSTPDNAVEYHLYWYEIPASPVPGAGTRLSTTPWRSAPPTDVARRMIEEDGTDDQFWDYAKPEIGNGFVVITSLRKALELPPVLMPPEREIIRIDLAGFNALTEVTLTHSGARQSTPAADAAGNVVWQDRRDGATSQIFWYTD